MTFIRYYYRHDEPDVVAADSTQKLLDDALKGRTYFKVRNNELQSSNW
jgi:hypothetical protein